MRALPLRISPGPGEMWQSYLTRVAREHGSTLFGVADHIGIRERSHWPPFHGIVLSEDQLSRAAEALNIDTIAVRSMQLAHYDQRAFDLTGLTARTGRDRLAAVRQVASQGWIHLAGTRYCPACLATDGQWRLEWRIPWITTCTIHRTWLIATCPGCGGTPGLYTEANGAGPRRTSHCSDTTRCDLPDSSTGVCGRDLTDQSLQQAPNHSHASTQRFRETMSTNAGIVAGADRTSLATLRAWQSAIGLSISLGQTRVDASTRNHRWVAPPREPRLVQHLVDTAAPIVSADSADEAAGHLLEWCSQARIPTPHRDTFARGTQPAEALKPVLDAALRDVGRVHIRIARQQHDANPSLPIQSWTIDAVPQVAWPCALPEPWREATKPNQMLLRAVIAMTLVRIRTGNQWTDCAALLGIAPAKGRAWTRYAFSSRFGSLKADLLRAANHVSDTLHHQPEPSPWARRPELPDGYGTTPLTHAQTPNCLRTDPTSPWCPCTDSTSQGAA